jgi:hypothetical protein
MKYKFGWPASATSRRLVGSGFSRSSAAAVNVFFAMEVPRVAVRGNTGVVQLGVL